MTAPEELKPTPICANCRFYEHHERECRRFPPILSLDVYGESGDTHTIAGYVFPDTLPEMWCGEHAQKEPVPE